RHGTLEHLPAGGAGERDEWHEDLLGGAQRGFTSPCSVEILVPTLCVGTRVPTLCVPPGIGRDAERRRLAFPRRAWERGTRSPRLYQICTGFGLTCPLASSGVTPNALPNSGMLKIGPMTRNFAGECGLVNTYSRSASGRISPRQSCAYDR